MLQPGTNLSLPSKGIWAPNVPTKSAFYAWEAVWGKVLTLDKLQRRGWHLPNRCYLRGCAAESINLILLHCSVVSLLWDIIFAIVGAHWVFPKTVKEAIISWKDSFVGKKRKKVWNAVLICIFWTVWKERNHIAFKDGKLAIHRLKNSFVYNLWSWNGLYLGDEASSLRFLEVVGL